MMTVNLNIKAHIDNLSLCDIFYLLSNYGKEKPKDGIMYFNGYKFRVQSTPTDRSIDYTIDSLD